MKLGQVWEQIEGQFVGRRGIITDTTNTHVTLDPFPGFCKCPLRQRKTKINRITFEKQWRLCKQNSSSTINLKSSAQVAEQAQTIQDGHERQAQLATKLHDTETQTLRLWRACLEYLKAPPGNVLARKKFAKFVTGGKSDA